MKKYILVSLILIAGVVPFFIFRDLFSPLKRTLIEKEKPFCRIDLTACRENILKYLRLRQDKLAWLEIEKALSVEPEDLCALWAKAELLRRTYKFKESQDLLNQILTKCPNDGPSLISLSYIKYHNNEFDESLRILRNVLNQPNPDKENTALAYMLIASINAKRASQGGFLDKIVYGIRIKGFFEKAKSIAPDLSEVHLGLGSFYLFAPGIIGGDLDRAIEELECAVKLAPDFATANARLAQGYEKKGDLEKYNFYLQRARELDPENEVLKELKENR